MGDSGFGSCNRLGPGGCPVLAGRIEKEECKPVKEILKVMVEHDLTLSELVELTTLNAEINKKLSKQAKLVLENLAKPEEKIPRKK